MLFEENLIVILRQIYDIYDLFIMFPSLDGRMSGYEWNDKTVRSRKSRTIDNKQFGRQFYQFSCRLFANHSRDMLP
jgi:hypothetical protein